MATIGNTGTPSGNYSFYGLNASNVMAIQVTMPQAGLITSLSCYFAAHVGSGSTTAAMCVWDSSGNLLARTATFSLAAGSGVQGGQTLHTANLQTAYQASNGQVLKIGWWRFANGSDEWTESNTSTEYQATDASNSTPPASETFGSTSGAPQIFATYTPSGAFINTGTLGSPVWTPVTPQINTGTLGSPIWTTATEAANTGTKASPVWS